MTNNSIIRTDLLVIQILSFSAYITTGLVPFLSLDDPGMLNSLVSVGQQYYGLFLGAGDRYFRPLVFVSFLLDFNLFGYNAAAFHLVNLVIHTANSLLVYYLAFLLVKPEPPSHHRAPLIASLLFALHPVNTEAVVWIAARTDLICCFFFLLAIIIAAENRLNISRSVVALFISVLLSLLAKESSVGLTGILLLWWLSQSNDEHDKRTLWLSVSAFAATVVYIVMRSGMQVKTDAGVGKVLASGVTKPLWQLIYDSAAAFGFYVSKAIYPFPLNFAITTINNPLSAVIFVSVLVFLLVLFVRSSQMRLPILIFSICLVPPILALHGGLPWTPYAERYLYLSMTGLSMMIGFVVSKLPQKIYLIIFTSILFLSIPTMQRVILWGDPMRFWCDVLQKSPEFPGSYVAFADELTHEKKYNEAEILLNKALQMGLNKDYVWDNLATVRLCKDDLYGYELAMLQSAELTDNPTEIYIRLILTVANKTADEVGQRRIIGYYLKANQRDPRFGNGLYYTAKIYLKLGEPDNALIYFRKFLQSPGDSKYTPSALHFIHNLESVDQAM
jgi:protein O-mannosyl-transferase